VLSTGMNGIPNYALLDGDGAVVMTGFSNRDAKKAEEAIAGMVKQRRKGRKDLPSEIAKVEVMLNKGEYTKALKEIDKLLAKPGSKNTEGILAGANSMKQRAESEIAASFKRFDWMLANGYPILAEELHKELSKEFARNETYAADLTDLAEIMKSDETKAELVAAKSFNKIRKAISEDGADDKTRKKLLKVVEKNIGTKVADRASFLAGLM